MFLEFSFYMYLISVSQCWRKFLPLTGIANNYRVTFLKCKSDHISVFYRLRTKLLSMAHKFLHDLDPAIFYFLELTTFQQFPHSSCVLTYSPLCLKCHTASSSSHSLTYSSFYNQLYCLLKKFDTTSSFLDEFSALGTNKIV